MQSSFNVIKSTSIIKHGARDIVTSDNPPASRAVSEFVEENSRTYIDSYENLAKSLIENARRQSEQILSKAYEEAQIIEDQARSRGYEEGYREAEETVNREIVGVALEKSEELIAKSEETLQNARIEYERYLSEKEQHIKALAVSIAENILKREVAKDYALNEMVAQAIAQVKNVKSVIIRCNGLYINELKKNASSWKEQSAFTGDLFILEDNTLENGNIIIDKDNGRLMLGIEHGLNRIKEILEGND